jgi:thiamine-phosphate pyrophosphorylase
MSSFRLCYITDQAALQPRLLVDFIQQAARAGVDLIQVREKALPTPELTDLVRQAVVAASLNPETRIVVNDRLDLALALSASGVHLTTQSVPARAVRPRVPSDFLIGVSCHSLDEAVDAEQSGADYIVLGPIFATPSKLPYGPPLGLSKLNEVTCQLGIPVLALGGITVQNAASCLDCGAAGIAGIRLFQECESMEERVQELRALF